MSFLVFCNNLAEKERADWFTLPFVVMRLSRFCVLSSWCQGLGMQCVIVAFLGHTQLRFVFHYDVWRSDFATTLVYRKSMSITFKKDYIQWKITQEMFLLHCLKTGSILFLYK